MTSTRSSGCSGNLCWMRPHVPCGLCDQRQPGSTAFFSAETPPDDDSMPRSNAHSTSIGAMRQRLHRCNAAAPPESLPVCLAAFPIVKNRLSRITMIPSSVFVRIKRPTPLPQLEDRLGERIPAVFLNVFEPRVDQWILGTANGSQD